MIATPMLLRNTEEGRRRALRWALLGILAAVFAALAVMAWAPEGAASPEDPCTAGFTCVTTCVNEADGNGATCTVQECAGAGACETTTTVIPATSRSEPRGCQLALRVRCLVVGFQPTACVAHADGFGAVCTLAAFEWEICLVRPGEDICNTTTIGGGSRTVTGTHFTPPPQEPPTETQAPVPTATSEAPPPPAPGEPPTTTDPGSTPAPTAPGQPAPAAPAPVPAPALPPAASPARRVANRIVIPFRSGFRLPPGFRRREACRGRVRVALRVGRRVLAVQTVRLNRRCRYVVTFRIRRVRLRGVRTVTVVARFRGNAVLGAAGRAYRVRIRRQ